MNLCPQAERVIVVNTSERARVLERVRVLCLALPEACEVEAWGHPTFRAGKKMFAAFHGEAASLALGLKMSFERQDELLNDERFYPTPYAARLGWVSLRLEGRIDWQMVGQLIREAYRQVALRRMLKVLEASADDG